jgi:hypothetical protein
MEAEHPFLSVHHRLSPFLSLGFEQRHVNMITRYFNYYDFQILQVIFIM